MPWAENQFEITDDDWYEYIGKVDYEVAYMNYFKDKIEDAKFDWKSVVKRFLLDEKGSLIKGILAEVSVAWTRLSMLT
jgi:hypothetical protein